MNRLKRIKEKLIIATLWLRGIVKVGSALGVRCDVEGMIQTSTKQKKILLFCRGGGMIFPKGAHNIRKKKFW